MSVDLKGQGAIRVNFGLMSNTIYFQIIFHRIGYIFSKLLSYWWYFNS